MEKKLDPTYLRYIYDGLIKGIVHTENASELPEGLIGLYEEAFEEHLPVLQRQQLLKRFALFALLKKEVSTAFVAEVLEETEIEISEFILNYASWFNSPEPGKFQLYHERLKVYILLKYSENEIQTIHEKLISRLENSIEEQQADEFERYALEYLSEHLTVEAFGDETKGKKLLDFTKNETLWDRQIRISNKFEWSRKGLHQAALWTSKHDQEENIDCYLDLVQLHNKEQNDAENIVRLVANNEIDLALERITAFGGPSKEEKERQFILFMLCLMELTLLESKTQPWRKEAIEKLLKHLEEEIPVDYSLVNWGEFFSSYLMFLIVCQIWRNQIEFSILYKLTNFWDKEWIDYKGPFTVEQKYVLKIGSEIAIGNSNPYIISESEIYYGLKDFQKIKNEEDLKEFINEKNQKLISNLKYKNSLNFNQSKIIFDNLILKYEIEIILKFKKINFDTNNNDLVLLLLYNADEEYLFKIIDFLVSDFFKNKINSYSIHKLNFLLNCINDFLGLNHLNSSIYFLENIQNWILGLNDFDSHFKITGFHHISQGYSKLNLNKKAIHVLDQALRLYKQEYIYQITNKRNFLLIDILTSLFTFGEKLRTLKDLDNILNIIKKDFWTYKDSLIYLSIKFSEIGELNKSFEIIEKYFLDKNEFNKAYYKLAEFLIKINKLDTAIQLSDKIINNKLKNDLLLIISNKHIESGSLIQAKEIASKINLFKQKVEAYTLVNLYLLKNNFKKESEICFSDTFEIIDSIKDFTLKTEVVWKFIYCLINESFFEISKFIYDKYNLNCKDRYMSICFNKKVELKYYDDCFNMLFYNSNYLEQNHFKLSTFNIKELGYKAYLNRGLNFLLDSLKSLSPKISRDLLIGIIEANIKNKHSNQEIENLLYLIYDDKQLLILLVQKFAIHSIFFTPNYPQEKLQKFNRVLDLQWAIDLKNELDQLPN